MQVYGKLFQHLIANLDMCYRYLLFNSSYSIQAFQMALFIGEITSLSLFTCVGFLDTDISNSVIDICNDNCGYLKVNCDYL